MLVCSLSVVNFNLCKQQKIQISVVTFDGNGPHWVIPYGFQLTSSENLEDLMNNLDAFNIAAHDYSQVYEYDDGDSTENVLEKLVQQDTLGLFVTKIVENL